MFLALALGIYRPDITWSSAPGIGPVDFSKNGLWLRSDSFHHDEPPATRVVHLRNRTPPYDLPGEFPGFFAWELSSGCPPITRDARNAQNAQNERNAQNEQNDQNEQSAQNAYLITIDHKRSKMIIFTSLPCARKSPKILWKLVKTRINNIIII